MKWIKINKNKLPKKEVLAACFQKGSNYFKEKTQGFLSYEHGIIFCENDNELLGDCTHYIDINKFDI